MRWGLRMFMVMMVYYRNVHVTNGLCRLRDVVARPTNDVRTLYHAINRILSLALYV